MGFLLFYLGAIGVYILIDRLTSKRARYIELSNACRPPEISPTDIVIPGVELHLYETELHHILSKRFPYYSHLNEEVKARFLRRIQRFMRSKTFIIKDEKGFREMPVLVSAAAIQLTFGLKHYLLPFYRYIRIYPEEYFADNSFKVLAGNVQGNIITVAWNHLLKGIENTADGANVGLHEMSHALYCQKLVVEENYSKGFARKYNHLLNECRGAFDNEVKGQVDLYSDYAVKDMQEFWAESVELFFEKPAALQSHYPQVYQRMVHLLNQDPLATGNPVIKKELFRFY